MSFFSYQYDPDVKFDMYTPMHLSMLGIFIVLMVLFFVFKDKVFNSQKEKFIRYVYASLLIFNLALLVIIEYSGGHLYLPFHLCSISYILAIILLFTNNKKVYYYLFYAGLIGGVVTFAIPDLYHAGYNRFRFYEFIIAHASIMIVPLYYLTCYKWNITLKTTIIGIIITNILGFGMWPVNILLRNTGILEDANFMFTMGPPPDVEAVFGTYPWHMLRFEVVLIFAFFLTYFLTKIYQDKRKTA